MKVQKNIVLATVLTAILAGQNTFASEVRKEIILGGAFAKQYSKSQSLEHNTGVRTFIREYKRTGNVEQAKEVANAEATVMREIIKASNRDFSGDLSLADYEWSRNMFFKVITAVASAKTRIDFDKGISAIANALPPSLKRLIQKTWKARLDKMSPAGNSIIVDSGLRGAGHLKDMAAENSARTLESYRQGNLLDAAEVAEDFVKLYMEAEDPKLKKTLADYGARYNIHPSLSAEKLGQQFPDVAANAKNNEILDELNNFDKELAKHNITLEEVANGVKQIPQALKSQHDSLVAKMDNQKQEILGKVSSEALQTREELSGLFQERFNSLDEKADGIMKAVDINGKKLDANKKSLDYIVNHLNKTKEEQIKKALEDELKGKKATLERQKIANQRKAVDVFSRAWGLLDNSESGKKDAKRFAVVAHAALDIRDAIKQYEALQSSVASLEIAKKLKIADKLGDSSALASVGTAALSLNLVSIGMTVVTAFMDQGPSADELILQQLAAIQETLQTIHKQMHERFDLVDEKLDKLMTAVDLGFDMVRGKVTANKEQLLLNTSIGLNLEALIVSETRNISQDLKDYFITPCEERDKLTSLPIPDEQYISCITWMRKYATDRIINNQLQYNEFASGASYENLLQYENTTNADSFNSFYNIFANATEYQREFAKLPAFENWYLTAGSYVKFLNKYIDKYHLINEGQRGFNKILKIGYAIENYRLAILEALANIKSKADESTSPLGNFDTKYSDDNFTINLTAEVRDKIWQDLPESIRHSVNNKLGDITLTLPMISGQNGVDVEFFTALESPFSFGRNYYLTSSTHNLVVNFNPYIGTSSPVLTYRNIKVDAPSQQIVGGTNTSHIVFNSDKTKNYFKGSVFDKLFNQALLSGLADSTITAIKSTSEVFLPSKFATNNLSHFDTVISEVDTIVAEAKNDLSREVKFQLTQPFKSMGVPADDGTPIGTFKFTSNFTVNLTTANKEKIWRSLPQAIRDAVNKNLGKIYISLPKLRANNYQDVYFKARRTSLYGGRNYFLKRSSHTLDVMFRFNDKSISSNPIKLINYTNLKVLTTGITVQVNGAKGKRIDFSGSMTKNYFHGSAFNSRFNQVFSFANGRTYYSHSKLQASYFATLLKDYQARIGEKVADKLVNKIGLDDKSLYLNILLSKLVGFAYEPSVADDQVAYTVANRQVKIPYLREIEPLIKANPSIVVDLQSHLADEKIVYEKAIVHLGSDELIAKNKNSYKLKQYISDLEANMNVMPYLNVKTSPLCKEDASLCATNKVGILFSDSFEKN